MSDLSPDATALFAAGRSTFRPDAADRERVLLALNLAVDRSTVLKGLEDAHRHKAAASASGVLKSWITGGIAAMAIGGGVLVCWHSWTHAPSHAASPSPATPVHEAETMLPQASPPLGNLRDEAETSVPAVASGAKAEPPIDRGQVCPARSSQWPSSGTGPRFRSDSLSEEVRLLSRAQQRISVGRTDEALKTLAEHERRFPNGGLAEERVAARVQTLCALGRTADAKSELAKLARVYPRSAHIEPARRMCKLDVTGP